MSKSSRQSSHSDRSSAANGSKLTFESALSELERLVAQMESGKLSLEQALAAHQRGLQLARYCQERLEAAQQQVKVLEGDILMPAAPAELEPSGDD